MRNLILAGLVAVAVAPEASAQGRPRLLGRRVVDSPSQNTLYLPPPAYPRLAAFAQPAGPFNRPGYVLPGVSNGRPLAQVLPLAVQSALFVISFIDVTPLYAVGNALPPAIRLAHVLLNGTPTPGQPGQTLLFIANPWAAEVRARVTQRRAGQTPGGGEVIYGEPVYVGEPVYAYPPGVVYHP
jgi:hypothetical protein